MTEFIMFGGKGGVGKTTCASATALSLAQDGEETLVVSTDPAHSIADVFDCEIGSDPTQIFDDEELYAIEVDPEKRFNDNYADWADAIMNEASNLGIDIDGQKFSGMEGGVIGSEEAAVIDLFHEFHAEDEWDYVVFDTAPTGHTLKMLKLPELLDGLVGTALNVKSKYDGIKNKVTGIIPGGDDEEDTDIDDVDVEGTRDKLETVGELLQDGDKTQFFPVMEAEEMSLLETERLLGELDSYSIPVGGVFVNKILTDIDEDCDLCSRRRSQQQDVIQRAESELGQPLLKISLRGETPRGDDLKPIAEKIQVT
jgi:arsenite-transporting ATPase